MLYRFEDMSFTRCNICQADFLVSEFNAHFAAHNREEVKPARIHKEEFSTYPSHTYRIGEYEVVVEGAVKRVVITRIVSGGP